MRKSTRKNGLALSGKGVVLVVEDHPLVRMGVLEVLIDTGFEALEAGSAVEAIRMLEDSVGYPPCVHGRRNAGSDGWD